jgi:bacterial leucyl aminopeptidase
MKLLLLVCIFFVVRAIEKAPQPNMRLIEYGSKRYWIPEEKIDQLGFQDNNRFIDVTDTQDLEKNPIPQKQVNFPEKPTQQTIVKKLLTQVSQDKLIDRITYLSTNFTSRHCTRQDGLKSANWIKSQYEEIINSLNPERRKLFSVEFIATPNRPQPSIVAKIKGKKNEVVILGAHEDSVTFRRSEKEPGADDNASGSGTVMEAFRIIATSDYVPTRQLEFHHVFHFLFKDSVRV